MVEHSDHVPVRAQLSGGEAVEVEPNRPSPQQVRLTPPDLPSAGSAEREAQAAVLVEPVDLVQERGNLLHFVHDDERSPSSLFQLLPETLWLLDVTSELVSLEEIDPDSVRICRSEERGFARLARSPEKEGLGSGLWKLELSINHVLKLSCIFQVRNQKSHDWTGRPKRLRDPARRFADDLVLRPFGTVEQHLGERSESKGG